MQPSDISVSCPACGDAESEIGGRLRLLRTLCISVLLTMPLFWNLHPLIQLAIASVLQFWPGAYFYKGAYKALRQGVLGMDFLVAVSTTVIYLHSACIALTVHHDVKLYFLSEGVLLSLILFGKYMECTSRYEASEAIRKLIRLQPETANVLRGGTVQAVEVHALTPGDIVQVRSGERVPIDGAVLSGSCTVDESMLTGESELIPKCAGARMYCGTLCREGDVTLSCTAVSEQTVLAQIIAIVSAAQSEKAPIARLADKIATVFVPVVILVAAGVFCLRYFVLDAGNLRSALNCVCSTLVIACPCALGLATPTSIMTGSGRAAELGVLFRGGEQLGQHGKRHVLKSGCRPPEQLQHGITTYGNGGGQIFGFKFPLIGAANQRIHIGNIRQQGGKNFRGHFRRAAPQASLPVKRGNALGHIQAAVGGKTLQHGLGAVHKVGFAPGGMIEHSILL